LIRASGDGIKALLIDLQRVKIGPPLTLQERWQNLSILQGGCTHASSTDRLRFLKQYLAYPTPLPIDLRPLVSQLEQKGRRHRFSLWRSRQKRCVAENREFMKIQAGSFFGFARRDCWHQDLQRLLREPERILAHPETQLVKRSTTTSVAVVRQSAGRLYVKRYNYQGLGYAIKDLFRSARARRAWIAANSLHMRGIPVALPVAYLERRRLGLLLDSYVLTEAKSGRNLRVVLNDYDRSAASVNTKRALLNAMARLVRKMHDRGVAHRDLKAPNVIAQAGPNNVCELFIVDFDGISLGVVSRNRREKNLARLAQERHRHRCLTRTDRLRFLKAYLATNDKKAWKKVWQAVDRHSR
jgi:tRNA A-37 threonylcarbamoyl transferase component Bud32